MYGKHFESLYRGSMYGAGAVVFAVWGYVIATMKPDREVGFQVELNSKLLANTLGEPEDTIADAIRFLCSPDPKSRSKLEEGRRLVQLSEYDYRVVNGQHYHAIRDEESRRAFNRNRQARYRSRKANRRGSHKPLSGEVAYMKALQNGASDEELEEITARNLPTGLQ